MERNTAPDGYQLLNSRNVGKHQSDDIVALAQQIQTADLAIRNTATGKLCLILEQVIITLHNSILDARLLIYYFHFIDQIFTSSGSADS